MSETNEENASIDEAIIDYLSKKAVVDQTEQAALARISSKVQTSAEQAERSLERLRAKDWLRKYKYPGKVSFELTPKGKAAMEAQIKARRERVTMQLQQAIQQQQSQLQQEIQQKRKTKLRNNVLNKMISLDEKWKNYQIPDKNQMASLEQEAAKILTETKDAQAKRPQCQITPESYAQEFLAYKTQIENLTKQNTAIFRSVNNYAQIKDALVAISVDIEKINKTIAKYEPEPGTTAQLSKLKATLIQLKQIQSQLETFESAKLSRMDELKAKLVENSEILDTLKKSSHEFAAIKKASSTEKTLLYPDPELPMIHDRQTNRGPLEEKCVKCGTKRKSTSVTIG